jgi:hypothetical protein
MVKQPKINMSQQNKIGSVEAATGQEALDKLRDQHPELSTNAPRDIKHWTVPKLLITFEGTELKVTSLVANGCLQRWIRREAAHSGETEERELEKQIIAAVQAFVDASGMATRVTWAA